MMNLASVYFAVRSLVTDRKGVTALEYGLIAALIAVVIIGAVSTVGTDVKGVFDKIAKGLTPAP